MRPNEKNGENLNLSFTTTAAGGGFGKAALFFFCHYYGRGRRFFQTVPEKISAGRLPLSLPTTPQAAVLPTPGKRKTGKGEALSVTRNVHNFYLVFITLLQ